MISYVKETYISTHLPNYMMSHARRQHSSKDPEYKILLCTQFPFICLISWLLGPYTAYIVLGHIRHTLYYAHNCLFYIATWWYGLLWSTVMLSPYTEDWFLTSALQRCVVSFKPKAELHPREWGPSTQCIRGWVNCRASLDRLNIMGQRKTPCLGWESNLIYPRILNVPFLSITVIIHDQLYYTR